MVLISLQILFLNLLKISINLESRRTLINHRYWQSYLILILENSWSIFSLTRILTRRVQFSQYLKSSTSFKIKIGISNCFDVVSKTGVVGRGVTRPDFEGWEVDVSISKRGRMVNAWIFLQQNLSLRINAILRKFLSNFIFAETKNKRVDSFDLKITESQRHLRLVNYLGYFFYFLDSLSGSFFYFAFLSKNCYQGTFTCMKNNKFTFITRVNVPRRHFKIQDKKKFKSAIRIKYSNNCIRMNIMPCRFQVWRKIQQFRIKLQRKFSTSARREEIATRVFVIARNWRTWIEKFKRLADSSGGFRNVQNRAVINAKEKRTGNKWVAIGGPYFARSLRERCARGKWNLVHANASRFEGNLPRFQRTFLDLESRCFFFS